MNFICDNLNHEKRAVPAIIVMANGMIYEEDEKHRVLHFCRFAEFLTKELIPYIDCRYRTIADKEHRAMAGLSMGSQQTSITTFQYSELFSYVGVFSGFVQDVLSGDQSHLSLDNQEKFEKNIRLFFRGIGENDIYYDFFKADDVFLQDIQSTEQKNTPALVKKIGRTTYVVRVHFSKTSKETTSDKIKRMLKNEIQKM